MVKRHRERQKREFVKKSLFCDFDRNAKEYSTMNYRKKTKLLIRIVSAPNLSFRRQKFNASGKQKISSFIVTTLD